MDLVSTAFRSRKGPVRLRKLRLSQKIRWRGIQTMNQRVMRIRNTKRIIIRVLYHD